MRAHRTRAMGGESQEEGSHPLDREQVTRAKSLMPSDADILDLADVFGLLGEPSRMRTLIALLHGSMCVRDLAAVVGLSESAMSHSLRLLRAHRVVNVHRDGRVAHYALADTHVRALLELGLAHIDHTALLHPAPTAGQTAAAATQISRRREH